jgi:tRNA threonylcarbamoyladenosine biosynthesis protein TsaB
MKILGIDSSTPHASVALFSDGVFLSESTHTRTKKFSDKILLMIDDVLRSAEVGIHEIDGFCVTSGPGSFTGLRVGVSLVKGFVLATDAPFWGVGTLSAMAFSLGKIPEQICAVLDARKQQVYSAIFQWDGDNFKRLTPDEALSAEELCVRITVPTVFIGSGLQVYGDIFSEQLGELYIQGEESNHSIAASAIRLSQCPEYVNKKFFDLNHLTIQYARKAEAEFKQCIALEQEEVNNGN